MHSTVGWSKSLTGSQWTHIKVGSDWATVSESIRSAYKHAQEINSHNTIQVVCFFLYFFWSFFFLYLRFFPFFLAIPAFGTTYLGWHVRLFLKQTSIQSLHLVASKVWIQLIKIKVYIFPPYFTHKIKTLFWTPSKMGVLKYLTFVSQINVMRQKIKHKNCTKMIKFILKIPVIKWCKEYINLILFYVTDHQSN